MKKGGVRIFIIIVIAERTEDGSERENKGRGKNERKSEGGNKFKVAHRLRYV